MIAFDSVKEKEKKIEIIALWNCVSRLSRQTLNFNSRPCRITRADRMVVNDAVTVIKRKVLNIVRAHKKN